MRRRKRRCVTERKKKRKKEKVYFYDSLYTFFLFFVSFIYGFSRGDMDS